MSRSLYAYRQDPAVPSFDDAAPLIVFDGQCLLCSRSVQFVLRHDKAGRFRFLAAQTALGQALYAHFGLRSGDYDSFVLLESGRAYVKSDAGLRVLAALGWPWAALSVGRIVPRALRDALYDWVARNRYRWFGVAERCYVPKPAERERFLG